MQKETSRAPATMKDIARRAGVSVMTVSRALRGDPNHSVAMRERITRLAEAMGYRPNPMISALVSTRKRNRAKSTTASIAVVHLGRGSESLCEKARRSDIDFLPGILEQAERQGYQVEQFIYEPAEISTDRLRRILRARSVRGMILMPAARAPYDFDFDFEGFAVVAIGFSVAHSRLVRVTSDGYTRTIEAVRGLAGRGYRRIGLINLEDLDNRFFHGMSAGIHMAPRIIPSGIKTYEHTLHQGTWSSPLNVLKRSAVSAWIRRHRLQVVMSQVDQTYETLVEEGFRIPEDLGYLHLHMHRDPTVASMDQLCRVTGRKAVDAVTAMIQRNEYELPEHPSIIVTPSVWRGGSTILEQCKIEKPAKKTARRR